MARRLQQRYANEIKKSNKVFITIDNCPLLAIHYQLLPINFKWERRQIKHDILEKTAINFVVIMKLHFQ